MTKKTLSNLNFQKLGGILPAIVQDADTNDVLMCGFMNKRALQKTLQTKKVTFWSRTKQRLWEKGEESGNSLKVVSIAEDCDQDTLLIKVKPLGPTCHTGEYSCFGTKNEKGVSFLQSLFELILSRKKEMPKKSYTASLFREGLGKILEKVEEESGEVLQAARRETRQRLIEESSDLLFHLMVLLAQKKIALADVVQELKRRNG